MKNLNTYNKFVNENYLNSHLRNFKSGDMLKTKNDTSLLIDVITNITENSKIDKNIKNEILNFIKTTDSVINESFFDKLKDQFPKAAKISSDLSDKAEKTLNSIIQKAKDSVSFIKDISGKVKDFFMNTLKKSISMITDIIKNSSEFNAKVKEVNDKHKAGLVKDIKTSREVSKWYKNDFIDKLTKLITKSGDKFLSSDVSESLVLEGGNVISTLVHKLESYPPFSWLHKVQQAGEAGANKLFDALSVLTNKMGGPTFELPVLAVLFGVVIEQVVKNSVGGGLIQLFGAATPLGMAISGLKMIALSIAFIVAVDAVVGNKILGH